MRVVGWEENGRPKLSPPVIVKLTKFGIGFAIGGCFWVLARCKEVLACSVRFHNGLVSNP